MKKPWTLIAIVGMSIFTYVGTCAFTEGYWATSQEPEGDFDYPWPQANEKPWNNQQEFSTRLDRIEQILIFLNPDEDGIGVIRYRGLSSSRLEPGATAGSKEYVYTDPIINKIVRWPEGFRWHYVDTFNVKPSKWFYDFVMEHPWGDEEIYTQVKQELQETQEWKNEEELEKLKESLPESSKTR